MMESKFIGKSKTFIGIIGAIAAIGLPLLGYNFTAADTAELANLWEGLIAGGFALFALFGKIVSKQPTHILPK